MISRLSFAVAVFTALTPAHLFGTTLHVPKDHATIQAAIDQATAGDTILVAAGTYRQRIRLKAGITLRSAGDDARGKLGLQRAEATILDGGGTKGEGPGVAMAEAATLDGFTVTNVGTYDDAEWNKHHATQGNEQPHEHIGQPGTAGIGVLGVTCTVRNNIVHHIGYTGIAIQGEPGKRCAPRILHNICHRNMGGGIGSMRGSTAHIEANLCFQNFYAGIGHEGASPSVIDNVCYENIRAGIGISEGACPVVRGNKCSRNRRAGIGIRTGSDTRPIVEDNDCEQNDMAGIGCEEECQPLLRNNRCVENKLAGIGCRENARPTIVGNLCSKNKAAGIGFDTCEAGRADVLNNRLLDNAQVAIGIHAGWKVRLAGNELSREGGLPPLVMVFRGAEADFADNTFRGSGVAGIRTEGVIRATRNKFECPALRAGGPPQFAIWGLPGADIVFSRNSTRGWRHALFADQAAVTACDNRVADYGSVGIKVDRPVGSPVIAGNMFESDRDPVGVSIAGDQGLVSDNRVEPPKQP